MEIIDCLKITDTAYGGCGVGRSPGGKAVFVPMTVEGDIVRAAVTFDKKQFAEARLLSVLEPSPFRVSPRCPLAGKCGGCLFAHIDPEAQIRIKLKIIKNAFRKYPHSLPDIEVRSSHRQGWRLRATLRAREGKVGFFAFKSNDFIQAESCSAMKKSLFEKIKVLAGKIGLTGDIYGIETDEGVALASVKGVFERSFSFCPFDGAELEGRISGLKRTSFNTPFGPVGVGYKTFFQSNRFLLDLFQETATNVVPAGLDITELYAGAGFFTAGLRERGRVRAAESDDKAVKLAIEHGYPVEKGDAGRFLSKIRQTDVIFLDPPRDGADKTAMENILRLAPVKIVYVSCNPVTLARDAIRLSEKYKAEKYVFFDMFPDTYHMESLCVFTKIR